MRLARTWVLVGVAALIAAILIAALALIVRGRPTHVWSTVAWEQPGGVTPTRYEVQLLEHTYAVRDRRLRLCLPADAVLAAAVRGCITGSCSPWTRADVKTPATGEPCRP